MTARPGARLLSTWEVRDAESLAYVRGCLHDLLGHSRRITVDDDRHAQHQDLVLVASELAANALKHAGPPARLELWGDGQDAVVSVVDHAPETAPELPVGRGPGEGGFGLRLALRVADDVGWYRTGSGEKCVWARFDLGARDVTPHRARDASASSARLPRRRTGPAAIA